MSEQRAVATAGGDVRLERQRGELHALREVAREADGHGPWQEAREALELDTQIARAQALQPAW